MPTTVEDDSLARMIMLSPLADRIDRHQQEQGLTDRELAELLGVSHGSPHNWRRGSTVTLTPRMQRGLSVMFQMTLNEVLELAGFEVSDAIATVDTLEGYSGPFHWISTAVFAGAEQLELDGNVLDLDAKGEVIDATDRFRQASPPEPEDGAAAGQVAA